MAITFKISKLQNRNNQSENIKMIFMLIFTANQYFDWELQIIKIKILKYTWKTC